MKILCIGKPSYDIIIPVDSYPIENNVHQITTRIESGGGEANNVAYFLAKWKMDSYFAGVIGKDSDGTKLLNEYNENHINTDFLEINKKINTSTNIVILSKDKKSKTVLATKNDAKLNNLDIDIKMDIVFADDTELASASKVIADKNIISIMDLRKVNEEAAEIAENATYIVISEEFACLLTNMKVDYKNQKTISELYNRLKKIYKKNNIIVILGKGYLYVKDGALRILPCLNKEINDYFFGAFIYGISNKFDVEKSLKYANIVSTYNILGRKDIPTLEEVEEKYASLK